MTLYALIARIKHKWVAKGRHGTHSPFVYNFIEQILRDTSVIEKRYLVSVPDVPLRFENIVSRIAAQNQYQTIVRQCDSAGENKVSPDMILLDGAPKEWAVCLDSFESIATHSIVIATNIHATQEHETAWKKLCSDVRVRMSVDLYGIGVLFFREGFKVKQHFNLKYR